MHDRVNTYYDNTCRYPDRKEYLVSKEVVKAAAERGYHGHQIMRTLSTRGSNPPTCAASESRRAQSLPYGVDPDL